MELPTAPAEAQPEDSLDSEQDHNSTRWEGVKAKLVGKKEFQGTWRGVAMNSILPALAAGFVATYFAPDPAPLSCAEPMKSVVELVKDNPKAWVQLPSSDAYEKACHLNQVAKQAGAQ